MKGPPLWRSARSALTLTLSALLIASCAKRQTRNDDGREVSSIAAKRGEHDDAGAFETDASPEAKVLPLLVPKIDAATRGRVLLEVTVDWEGRILSEENLRAMEHFRARFPDVAITHFLNAAYYTKPGADHEGVSRTTRRVLRPIDELGLHIHGWKRLVEAAGVTFRREPTFWGTAELRGDCSADCGHEVALGAYTSSEIESIVRFSLTTLEREGFGRATTFRCGGWMAEPHVLAALAHEGVKSDHSAVPAKFLANEIGTMALHHWVDELWRGTTETSQPTTLRLDGDAHGASILEIPDNAALADYMEADEMVSVYEANRTALARDPSHDVVVSLGFHQETAAKFSGRVTRALETIFAKAEQEGTPLASLTAKEIAAARTPLRTSGPPPHVLPNTGSSARATTSAAPDKSAKLRPPPSPK